MNVLNQLIILLLMLFIGINFIKLLRAKMSLIELLSSGFILGIGISTFSIFLLGLLGVKFNFNNILFTLFLENALTLILIKSFSIKYSPRSFIKVKDMDFLDILFVVGIIFFVVGSLIRNLYWPIWSWDSVQLFDYRAKLIVSSQTIFFTAQSFYDISYPLLTSILHALLYAAGSVNPQYVYTLIFTSLIFGVYSFCRRTCSKTLSLFIAFLLSFYPLFNEQSITPVTNLLYSTFLVFGIYYSVLWLIKREFNYLILSSLLFSFSRFTRNEPIWIATLVMIIIYLLLQKTILNRKSIFGVVMFFVINYFSGFTINAYIKHYSFNVNKYYVTQFEFFGSIVERLKQLNLNVIHETIKLFYSSVVSEMVIPVLLLLIFIYLTKLRVNKISLLLLYFSVSYFFVIFGGTIFYGTISTSTEFLALSGSLDVFSIFWKVLVMITTTLFISDFFASRFEHDTLN